MKDDEISLVLALMLLILPFVSGCVTRTQPEPLFPVFADKNESDTEWVEEIRGPSGAQVLGYLEKQTVKHKESPEHRSIYYVYDESYGDASEGMILDTGHVILRVDDANTKNLGPLGLTAGVKRILNTTGNIQFYRGGQQVFHER